MRDENVALHSRGGQETIRDHILATGSWLLATSLALAAGYFFERHQMMLRAIENHISRNRRRRHLHFAQMILRQQLVNRTGLQHINIAIFIREIKLPTRRDW